MSKRLGGTREWAKHNDNVLAGCSHGCLYCYARHNSVVRFKRMTVDEWEHPRLADNWFKKRGRKKGGVMFPTTHDILPRFLEPCLTAILDNLAAGNRLLIVTKPHLYCVSEIVRRAKEWRQRVLFRFTIGSPDDDDLALWEPGAPCLGERLESLCVAFHAGYQTSVSCEPLLSPTVASVRRLLTEVGPHTTHSVWIGMLNHARQRVQCETPEVQNELQGIERGQEPENVRAIYEAFKDHPLVKWKESYRKVVGLPLASSAEMEG